jgi:hypothetical protein
MSKVSTLKVSGRTIGFTRHTDPDVTGTFTCRTAGCRKFCGQQDGHGKWNDGEEKTYFNVCYLLLPFAVTFNNIPASIEEMEGKPEKKALSVNF